LPSPEAASQDPLARFLNVQIIRESRKIEEKTAMNDVFKWFLSRFFRIYFAFCLLAFAVLVLLMNIPHALTAEQEALTPNHRVVSS